MLKKVRHIYEVVILFTFMLPLFLGGFKSQDELNTQETIEPIQSVQPIKLAELKVIQSQIEKIEDITEEEAEEINQVYTTTRVHLRGSDSIESESLSILDPNLVLDTVEKHEEWSYVDYEGTYGWVKSDYLRDYDSNSYLEIELGYTQQDLIKDTINEFGLGVDEYFVYGMIYVESRFQTASTSSAGASGIIQIMPSTWNYLYPRLKEEFPELSEKYNLKDDTYDVDSNLLVGLYYLYHLKVNYLKEDSLQDSPDKVLTMYHIGPGNSASYYKNNSTYSTEYSQDVLRAAEFIRENKYWEEGI